MRRVLALITLLIVVIPLTSATSIGVSKAVVNYNDVLKGGYAEETFVTTTDSQDPVSIEYEFLGEIADWLTLESDGDFSIQANEPETLKLIIEPPVTVANGRYDGILRITTGQLVKNEGQFGSIIRTAFRIRVSATVTGRQIQECNVGGANLANTEFNQPLELAATINNKGNVDLKPLFEIDVWNAQQTKLVETYIIQSQRILRPSQVVRINEFINHDLDRGQYFADITVDLCGGIISDTFQILDVGEIADEGILVNLYNQPWAKVNDIIPISANFKNTGERTVNAKLKGTILLDGRVIKVIDTDSVNVGPGETVKLDTFFNPIEMGQYLIKVRVLYNNKLTFEKESLVNVNPSGEDPNYRNSRLEWYPIVMIVLAVTLVTLLLMIFKKKKTTR